MRSPLIAIVAIVAVISIATAGVVVYEITKEQPDEQKKEYWSNITDQLNADSTMRLYVGSSSYSSYTTGTSSDYYYFRLATIDGLVVTYLGPETTGTRTVTTSSSFGTYADGVTYTITTKETYTTDTPIPGGYPANAVWVAAIADSETSTTNYIPYDSITRVTKVGYT